MATYREPWEYWDDYCEAEAEYEALCPVCDDCGESITAEEYYEIDGRIICPDCLKDYRKWTDDYVRAEEERRRDAG